MTEMFEFSPLLSAYLLDPRIQNAVDDLSGKTLVKGFDPTFTWAEFPAYVDTWLAAQQTVAEWCKAQFDLWDQVWGSIIDAPQYTRRIDTHDILDVGGIHECWLERWISRHVTVHGHVVGLTVHCDTEEAYLSIEFSGKIARNQKRILGLTDWVQEESELFSPSVKIQHIRDDVASIDLTEIRQVGLKCLLSLSNLGEN